MGGKVVLSGTEEQVSHAAPSQDPEQHVTELREPTPGTNQCQPSEKASKGKGL